MEDDLLRRPLSVNEDTPAVSLAEEEFAAQETTYGHVSASGDDEDYDDQEWSGGALEKCNLIVNYLPHEIDDVTLKVRAQCFCHTEQRQRLSLKIIPIIA